MINLATKIQHLTMMDRMNLLIILGLLSSYGCLDLKGKSSIQHSISQGAGLTVVTDNPVAEEAMRVGSLMLGNLRKELALGGYNAQQVAIVSAAAQEELNIQVGSLATASLSFRLFEDAKIPGLQLAANAVVTGAMKSLSDPELAVDDPEKKAAGTGIIVTSSMKSIQSETTEMDATATALVAETLIGAAVTALPSTGMSSEDSKSGMYQISMGAIAPLSQAGFSIETVKAIAETVVATSVKTIAAMDMGDVGISDLVSEVTKGAVASLATSTNTGAQNLEVLDVIVSGSIRGVAAAKMSDEDLVSSMKSVTTAAVSQLDEAKMTGDIGKALDVITTGSIKSVTENKAFSSTVANNVTGAMITGVVSSLDKVNMSGDDLAKNDVFATVAKTAMTAIVKSNVSADQVTNMCAKVVDSAISSAGKLTTSSSASMQTTVGSIMTGSIAGVSSLATAASSATAYTNAISSVTQSATSSLATAGVAAASINTFTGIIVEKTMQAVTENKVANASTLIKIASAVTTGVVSGVTSLSQSGTMNTSALTIAINKISNNVVSSTQTAAMNTGIIVTVASITAAVNNSATTAQATMVASMDFQFGFHMLPQVLRQNASLDYEIKPWVRGEISSCSVTPDLPTGLVLNLTTCAISGTPTSTTIGAKNYTFTARSGTRTRTETLKGLGIAAADDAGDLAAPYVKNITIMPTIVDLTSRLSVSVKVQLIVSDDIDTNMPSKRITTNFVFLNRTNIGVEQIKTLKGYCSYVNNASNKSCVIDINTSFYRGNLGGIWKLDRFFIRDDYGNYRIYQADQLQEMIDASSLPQISVVTTAPVDTTPPTFVRTRIFGTSDLSETEKSFGNTKIEVTFRDDRALSGSAINTEIEVATSGSWQSRHFNIHRESDCQDSPAGTNEMICSLYENLDPGSYNIVGYDISDNVGNITSWRLGDPNPPNTSNFLVDNVQTAVGCTTNCSPMLNYPNIPKRIPILFYDTINPIRDAMTPVPDSCDAEPALNGSTKPAWITINNDCSILINAPSGTVDTQTFSVAAHYATGTSHTEVSGFQVVSLADDTTAPEITNLTISPSNPNSVKVDGTTDQRQLSVSVFIQDKISGTDQSLSHSDQIHIKVKMVDQSKQQAIYLDSGTTLRPCSNYNTETQYIYCDLTVSTELGVGYKLGSWFVDFVLVEDNAGNRRMYRNDQRVDSTGASLLANKTVILESNQANTYYTDTTPPSISTWQLEPMGSSGEARFSVLVSGSEDGHFLNTITCPNTDNYRGCPLTVTLKTQIGPYHSFLIGYDTCLYENTDYYKCTFTFNLANLAAQCTDCYGPYIISNYQIRDPFGNINNFSMGQNTSSPLSIVTPPGACQPNSGPNFITVKSGCKYLTEIQNSVILSNAFYYPIWSAQSTSTMILSAAETYCSNLKDGGGGVLWRLPTQAEMHMLYGYLYMTTPPVALNLSNPIFWVNEAASGSINQVSMIPVNGYGPFMNGTTGSSLDNHSVICVRSEAKVN